MARKRVTLADVAAAAGVSPTTASLVLTGRGRELRISDIVQERVHAVSDELGYRPNIVSIGLSKGTTKTIGFVSDTVATSQLAGDMIRGALEAAQEHGYMLFIGETEGDAASERQLIDAMLDRQVDGVILASMFTRLRPLPSTLDGTAAVMLNALPVGASAVPSVVPDEYAAGRSAVRLLLEAGHRTVHLIGAGPGEHDVPPATVAGRERLAGIRDELASAGLSPASGRLCDAWLPPNGFAAVSDLLADDPDPRALICFNDRLAFGAYQALQEAGLRVPSDVSVVSFDNATLAEWLRPGLTTFGIPHEELGRRAVEVLLGMREKAEAAEAAGSPAVHRLSMPLFGRGSVAAAATEAGTNPR